jgi:ATP-binding cassette subfamily B protein RaxB
METVRSLQGIKIANREIERQGVWRNKFADSINTSAKVSRLTIFYETANSLVTGIEYVLIIYLGSQTVLTGEFTIGMLYAFLMYRSHFSNSVISLIDQGIQYLMLELHLDRLSDITQSAKEYGLDSTSNFAIPIKGGLCARDIEFRYSQFDPCLISEFNLEIGESEFVAIWGPSGVGKTTLLKILAGLLAPTKGELRVDGQSLTHVGIKSYRRGVGTVLQNDALFSGSIRDNIAFHDLTPDLERIEQCAKYACIHDEIVSFPMSYDSLIGDMGSSLSIGQQQRILIARALYSNPKILFLDEGTAHIDTETEETIFKNLQNLKITCVYTTHRKSLVALSDKVISWTNGTPYLTVVN